MSDDKEMKAHEDGKAGRQMTPKWLHIIYALAALSFAFLCAAAGVRAWQVGGALKGTIGHIDELAQTATKTAEETRLAASRFNEPERVARFDDYMIKQAASALANTQNTRRIGANLNTAIKEDLRPLLQDLRPRLNAQIEALTETTRTLNAQIAANGDRVQALLDEGKILVADSRLQVVDLLKELNATAHGLSVITNDPDLAKLIDNLNATSGNLAGTTGHIETITEDLAGLSNKYLEPLYKPQKRSFFGKLGAGVIQVFRYLNGAGQIVYLIGRF